MRIFSRFTQLIVVAAAVMFSTVLDVSAQGRRDAVVIEITRAENSCLYQVQDVSGEVLADQQDTFFVNAGAFLRLTATGTSARVEIQDDRSKNAKGFSHRGTARLNPGESQVIKARNARSQNPGTVHKVAVDCCERISEDGTCVNPSVSDKMAAASDQVQINRATFGSPLSLLSRLLFGAEEADPPLGSGGPDMDVEP